MYNKDVQVLKEDIDDFEKLILEYEKLIYNISYRIMSNHEDAKDISQEVLIKLYKNLNKYKNIKAVKKWIYTITSNTCIDEIRKRKNKQTESLDKEFDTEQGSIFSKIVSNELSPEDSFIIKENCEYIQYAVSKLPYNYKILIILRDIDGLSYNEICDITGLSLGTLKSRISRARVSLKNILCEILKES